MTRLNLSLGPMPDIMWYMNDKRKYRAAKKLRAKIQRRRASACLLYTAMFKPGVTASDARAIKTTARRHKVSRHAKQAIFANLLFHKRANYEAIKLRIRQLSSCGNHTPLRSVLIHPRQLEWYQQNHVVVEIIRP